MSAACNAEQKVVKTVPGPVNPSTSRAYIKFEKRITISSQPVRAFAIAISESKDPLKYANRTVHFYPSNLNVILSFSSNDDVDDTVVEDENHAQNDMDFDAVNVDENGFCYYPIVRI